VTSHTGVSFGRYHVLEQLGEGGMAVVYKAFDTRLESNVAVKVIRIERITPDMLSRALKRFEHEAKALARLTHPNIVKVIDFGESNDRPYLVMPLLAGGNLKQMLQSGSIPWRRALNLLIPVARALGYAHRQGVIHRDVKPSNILITESGEPMLTDFGVAKIIEEGATIDLTGTAAALGTPEYMAPEQTTSRTVDERADVYSLGIVLYEMVTGRKPFTADTPLAVLIMQAKDPLPRPTRFVPNLPESVERILLKALAKDPADRYSSMEEMASAMEACGRGEAPEAPEIRLRKSAPAPTPSPEHAKTESAVSPESISLPHTGKIIIPGPRRKDLPWIGLSAAMLLLAAFFLTKALSITETPTPSGPSTGSDGATRSALAAVPIQAYSVTLFPTDTVVPSPTDNLNIPPADAVVGDAWMSPADGMVLMYVPEGEFLMGSAESDSHAYDNEKPQNAVYLSGYWIDRTEVTNRMFRLFVEATQYRTDAENGDGGWVFKLGSGIWEKVPGAVWHDPAGDGSGIDGLLEYPVVQVSWNDAQAYCRWAGRRLPTEAEWEKGARSDDGRAYPWGNEAPDCQLANYWKGENGCARQASAVGSYPSGSSPYGLMDMAGNVWEWVEDWFSESYYSISPYQNPHGPASGEYKAMRGGTWWGNVRELRVVFRHGSEINERSAGLGFRCVL
jgi:serine/threonine protein kinase